MHKKMKKKFFSLWTGELTATIVFALVWIAYVILFDWAESYLTSFSTLYAFALLEFVLLQGSYYWFLKWKQIKGKDYSYLPYGQLRIFSLFKRVNIFLIGIGIIVLIYQIIVFPLELYWFLFLFLFAIIEYINYYHIRLSYLTMDEIKGFIRQRGFRSSKLAKELKSLQ